MKITLELSSELNKKLQKVLELKSHAIPDRNVLILFKKLLDAENKKQEGLKRKSQAVSQNLSADQYPNAGQYTNKDVDLNSDAELNPPITSATNVSTSPVTG